MEQSLRKRQRKSSNPMKFTPIYDVEKIIRNQTDVVLALAKHILPKGSNSNVVFSPISVQLVLGLIAAGSEGHALNQLLSFLKVDSTQELNALASHVVQNVFEGPASLSLANGVWTDRSVSFKPFFERWRIRCIRLCLMLLIFGTR